MKREIKFRIYCDFEKKMLTGVDLHNALTYSTGASAITLGRVGDSRTLMQFTGLLDSAGNPIFEGDIVKIPGDTPEDDSLTVIEYRAPAFIRRYLDHGKDWDGVVTDGLNKWHIDNLKLVVIGNIYEHPHLISAEAG